MNIYNHGEWRDEMAEWGVLYEWPSLMIEVLLLYNEHISILDDIFMTYARLQ